MIGADRIAAVLRDLGVRSDDVLWVHSGVSGIVGVAGATSAEKVATLLDGLERAVPDGVLGLPTFTYSATRGEVFDVERTPSRVGVLGEHFRARPGVRRTADPIFSSALRGALPDRWERRLLAPHDTDCFGSHSVFGYLREADAKLLFLGVGFGSCTYVHHVEQRLGVRYRYRKAFPATVRAGVRDHRVVARYLVRDLDGDVESYFDPLADALAASGHTAAGALPRGAGLLVTRARAVEAEVARRLPAQPDFLLRRGHRELAEAVA